ncbi:hypothetical protein H2136_20180 [Aeromonas hydrophila]|uniref:Uncharacterized protein n=1 Tax=Aeromonas hydrophila TaxID=644 RepID=A0A926FNM3_AERHY|nr:hypothetical protein [Aeromonas hydrophila]
MQLLKKLHVDDFGLLKQHTRIGSGIDEGRQNGGDLIQLADPVMGIMLAMSKYIPTAELKYLPSATCCADLTN